MILTHSLVLLMQGTDGYVVSLHLLILTKENNVSEINGKAGLHLHAGNPF